MGAPIKPGMSDQTDSNIARSGAAKRPQKSFPIKEGMTNQQTFQAGRGIAGTGPDASSPDPMAKEAISKGFGPAPTAWGMKGEVDHALGSAVLSEASLKS